MENISKFDHEKIKRLLKAYPEEVTNAYLESREILEKKLPEEILYQWENIGVDISKESARSWMLKYLIFNFSNLLIAIKNLFLRNGLWQNKLSFPTTCVIPFNFCLKDADSKSENKLIMSNSWPILPPPHKTTCCHFLQLLMFALGRRKLALISANGSPELFLERLKMIEINTM